MPCGRNPSGQRTRGNEYERQSPPPACRRSHRPCRRPVHRHRPGNPERRFLPEQSALRVQGGKRQFRRLRGRYRHRGGEARRHERQRRRLRLPAAVRGHQLGPHRRRDLVHHHHARAPEVAVLHPALLRRRHGRRGQERERRQGLEGPQGQDRRRVVGLDRRDLGQGASGRKRVCRGQGLQHPAGRAARPHRGACRCGDQRYSRVCNTPSPR